MNKLLIPTLLASLTLANAATNQEIKVEAKNAIMTMGKTLKMNMKKNIKQGGALQAAQFCSKEATNIEAQVNKTYPKGVSVKRVSLKYRNEANKPLKDEKLILESLQHDLDIGKKLPKMIVKQVAPHKYKVYKPLIIQKGICLTCHGDAQTRDPKAYELIAKKYPHDKAIDYKIGDLRGAFVAEIVK